MYEDFLDTDFTYAGLGFLPLYDQYKLLGEEELAGGRTYKVEEKVLQKGSQYSRIINWIATDSMLPLRRDFFDLAGRLWKRELSVNSVINGVPTPVRILMKDLQRGFGSELNVTTVDYDIKIPNEVFKPELLPEVVKCPLWLKYCPLPPPGRRKNNRFYARELLKKLPYFP
jgi:hypothetical protein